MIMMMMITRMPILVTCKIEGALIDENFKIYNKITHDHVGFLLPFFLSFFPKYFSFLCTLCAGYK